MFWPYVCSISFHATYSLGYSAVRKTIDSIRLKHGTNENTQANKKHLKNEQIHHHE
jgi:hypothetical protein